MLVRACFHCLNKTHGRAVAKAESLGLAGGDLNDVPSLALSDCLEQRFGRRWRAANQLVELGGSHEGACTQGGQAVHALLHGVVHVMILCWDSGVVLEGLGLANDSNLSSAPFGRSAVATQWVAIIDDRMHSDQAGEGDA